MGFNTLFALKASDLPKIAQDEHFGEKLRIAVVMSHGRERLEADERAGSGVFLSELSSVMDHASDYDMQIGKTHHADHTSLHVVQDGAFWTIDHAGKAPWAAHEALAEKMAEFGYRTAMKTEKFVVDAKDTLPVDDAEAEWDAMDAYAPTTFENSLITFIVMNDALDGIGKDKGLGKRVANFATEWWKSTEQGNIALIERKADKPQGWINDSLGAGNHANPIQIIGVTPAWNFDVVLAGGNCGRKLQTHQTVNDTLRCNADASRADLMERLRQADLNVAKDALLTAGFHVRLPGRERSESPRHWSRDSWITKPAPSEEDNDAGGPRFPS